MACPLAATQDHDWRMRTIGSFFPIVTALHAGSAWLPDLRHASLSWLLYQNQLVAVPMPLMLLGTHRVLVNHIADKCTRLAVDGVLAQSAAGGEVIKVRMSLHLLERGKLGFTQADASTMMRAVFLWRDGRQARQITPLAGRKHR